MTNLNSSTFDDQIETKGSQAENGINDKINEWLENKGFIKLILDEVIYVESTEITFKGTTEILKHFKFVEEI